MIQFLAKKQYLILALIFIVAGILRLWQLNSIPPGIHADEADTGYSAYSILKTGLTQYGEFNPLALREFNGGTHPPLYTYSLIPLVKFFGLNIVVERMPSVIFGTMTIPVFFFLLKKLFSSDGVALTGAALLTFNPWEIHMSRQGLLESIAVFFVMLGILFFLYGSYKRYFYILSAITLGLSLHAYDAPKIFVPLFLVFLVWYRWNDIKKVKKYIIKSLLIFVVFYLLTLKVLFLDGQINDYTSVGLLNSTSLAGAVNSERRLTNASLGLSSIFHNKYTVALKRFQTSYFEIFSVNWLFVNGEGNLQQAVANHGQFHLFELPFFFLGLYALFRYKAKEATLLLIWFLIAVVPGAITQGNHPYRSVLLLPVPIMFTSFGLVWFWKTIGNFFKALTANVLKVVIVALAFIYISSFLFTYFFDYPVYASEWWYKERNDVLEYVSTINEKYKNIYVVGGIEWPILYAFKEKVDPREFQLSYKHKDKYKDIEIIKLGKFSFGDFQISEVATPSSYFPTNSLIVVDEKEFKDSKSLRSFRGPEPLRVLYKVIEVN